MPVKTDFDLEFLPKSASKKHTGKAFITFHGKAPIEDRASTIWIRIDNPYMIAVISEKDAERFAVNILKSLKSKRLVPKN